MLISSQEAREFVSQSIGLNADYVAETSQEMEKYDAILWNSTIVNWYNAYKKGDISLSDYKSGASLMLVIWDIMRRSGVSMKVLVPSEN